MDFKALSTKAPYGHVQHATGSVEQLESITEGVFGSQHDSVQSSK
jgi:hypothetical protein